MYLDNSILYIGIKEISFRLNGNTYRCLLYGNNVSYKEGTSIPATKPFLNYKILSRVKDFMLWSFAIAVIAGAWYTFCASYFHFNGFYLLINANGYKCFLPFLGTLLLTLAGRRYLDKSIKDILTYRDASNLTYIQRWIRKSILKKFGL